MLKKQLLFTLFLYVHNFAFTQGWRPVGARSNSLASTSVCLDDVWAYHYNPGATARIRSFRAGIYYDARFSIREMQSQAFAVAIPLKKGVLSAGGQFYGSTTFRTTRAGLGYALPLTEKLSFGVQINLQQLRLASNYGSSVNATFEAGLLAKISEKWSLGVSVMNIGRQRILPLKDERLTSVMRIGGHYKPSKKVAVLFEAEKQVLYPISFKGAVEYWPSNQFVVRFGAHSGPTEIAFGMGYKTSEFSIDLGSNYHPVLGWTPHVGFTYQFPENEK